MLETEEATEPHPTFDKQYYERIIDDLRTENANLIAQNVEVMQENSQLENAIFQANDMALRAESASHSKSQFLADMSHEIRTPMNAVLGMASMMEGTKLTADQRDFVETIRQSGETLMDIINDILDFSKIEAGRIDMESIPLQPRNLVNETINLLRLKAENKRLYLRSVVDDDVPKTLIGDPTRIRQILINLVGNAIKFTSKGGIDLRVELDGSGESSVRLRFSVSDTGIGIPKDRMERLFRPFSQVDASTTRNYGGTGLGLAISSKLSELMNGRMWVESTTGKGSTFYFEIEILNPPKEDSVTTTADNNDSNDDTAFVDPANVKLLLAEDNAINSKVAMLLLRRAGYNPDLAENGKQVLEAFKHKHYDIVLMDVQMPEMDGLTATRKLRKVLGNKGNQPFIIALTASAGKPDHNRCIDAGMDAFLPKPIRVNDMLALLKTAPMHQNCAQSI